MWSWRLPSAACLLALLGSGACGAGSPARPDHSLVVEPIQVDSVSVSVMGILNSPPVLHLSDDPPRLISF